MWWTDATGTTPQIVTVHGQAASLALGVQEFGGLKTGAPDVFSLNTGDLSPATATVSTLPSGDLEIGMAAGHASAAAVTLSLANQEGTVTTSGTSSIASITTGYEVPGSHQTVSGTFSSSMWWAAGVALFAPTG